MFISRVTRIFIFIILQQLEAEQNFQMAFYVEKSRVASKRTWNSSLTQVLLCLFQFLQIWS